MGEKTAVTAVCWIPRGRCRPKRPEVDDGPPPEVPSAEEEGKEDELKDFDMDNYDDEQGDGGQIFQVLQNEGPTAFAKDEYLQGDTDIDSDSEDYHEVRPTDDLFVAVSCEEDVCTLEVYVYDDEDCSMYVHHDIMLPSYPLCIDWFDGLKPTHADGVGNFCAVGGFASTIDVWDLDDLGAYDPLFSLGAKEKQKKAHGASVMCLHASPFKRTVLASGGGDNLVKLWDLTAPATAVNTIKHHTDKVQCVKWHPSEQAVLLTAAFDKTMGLQDVRQQRPAHCIPLSADAEAATWGSTLRPAECFVSCEDGVVFCFDARKMAKKGSSLKPLWTLSAHEKACTTLQQPKIKDMLVTASIDETAKVWKIEGGKPSLVFSKDLHAGPLFASMCNDEVPNLVVFGGKSAVLWDLEVDDAIVEEFGLEVADAS